MSLKPGHYRIRIVSVEHPNPGPGGMYLTLAPDGEVLVEAQVPSTFNRQKVSHNRSTFKVLPLILT